MTLDNDNGTDGQTDRRTDKSATQYAAPPREEGRIIKVCPNTGIYRRSAENLLFFFCLNGAFVLIRFCAGSCH